MPPQPDLLARRRLGRHRPRCPRPPDPAGRPTRHEAARAPQTWLAAPGDTETALSAIEAAEEYLMMSLRLAEGADLARFRALGGPDFYTKSLESNGFIVRNGDRLQTTQSGRLLLNTVLRELLA